LLVAEYWWLTLANFEELPMLCEEQRTIKAPTGLYYEVVVDDLRKTLQYKSSRSILIS